MSVYYKDMVIVLMYHHIDQKESSITITPDRFITHLYALQQHGLNVISMDIFLRYVYGDTQIPVNAILLTFDDGYRSFYTYAYPELRKRGLPVANFVLIHPSDTEHPNYLTWDQMREMKSQGMSFYNHTYDHHRYMDTGKYGDAKPVLSNPVYLKQQDRPETRSEYRSRIKQDLQLAEKRLHQELGEQANLLAFPYGAYSETVVEIGKMLGIQLFFTVEQGVNLRRQILINRLNAGSCHCSPEQLIEKIRGCLFTET